MRRAGTDCNDSNITMNRQNTKENIASIRCWRGFSIGTASMRSLVMILVPCGQTRNDFEAALREHAASAEFVDMPNETHAEPVEDAEQLPLWRWFTF